MQPMTDLAVDPTLSVRAANDWNLVEAAMAVETLAPSISTWG